MEGFERERFEDRINGMSAEEQAVAVSMIDTDLLWDELRRRETETRIFKKKMEEFVCKR